MFTNLSDPRDLNEIDKPLETDLILQVGDDRKGNDDELGDWDVSTEEEFL